MHRDCFYKYYQQQANSKGFPCFLCKKTVNIVVPELSKKLHLGKEETAKAVDELFERIYLTLLSEFSEEEEMLAEADIERLKSSLLLSFCKDLAYNALQDLEEFKRNNFAVYREIYCAFAQLPQEEVAACFEEL